MSSLPLRGSALRLHVIDFLSGGPSKPSKRSFHFELYSGSGGETHQFHLNFDGFEVIHTLNAFVIFIENILSLNFKTELFPF